MEAFLPQELARLEAEGRCIHCGQIVTEPPPKIEDTE